MRKSVTLFLTILAFMAGSGLSRAQNTGNESLPVSVKVGGWNHHVQGIALDAAKGCMYFSFTTSFVKTDLKGNVLATIDRIQGHLGAMSFDPVKRKVYASLECKDDKIGKNLSKFAAGHSLFYVAIIDVDKLDHVGMDPEGNDFFRVVCIRPAVEDYAASVMLDGGTVQHRLGCSGIDGVAIAPKIGKKGGKNYLYVAYGVYGDPSRTDNDYQVLLRYDLRKLDRMASPVTFGQFSEEGPERPSETYYVYTGNTRYGVQNMAYDPETGLLLLAVYRGNKPQYPNYDLFGVDMTVKPSEAPLQGVPYMTGNVLQPALAGNYSTAGPQGWYFPYGNTGLCPVGGGLWYISENGKDPATRKQFCNAQLYRWVGGHAAFVPVRK